MQVIIPLGHDLLLFKILLNPFQGRLDTIMYMYGSPSLGWSAEKLYDETPDRVVILRILRDFVDPVMNIVIEIQID
ncbi:hypothetical protein SSP24_84060 [Streptomyces spinoverrucosus]|uniref:Uncharacterized protein n=1 Tax=Streptomyces spinoverrucosus TaxID=284043 RepID=A0A4Y3VYD2_9ACTN|nr:hypothetical protein SSP24_84060 [Streptomyces spinoverrucosus]GHC00064.1 hypothetical protein GCM10010397_85090 [Streptomyces spinoverrucosus]